jgi:hypothetical protein
VLVHGGVSDRTYWAPVLPALTEQFTVVVIVMDEAVLGPGPYAASSNSA